MGKIDGFLKFNRELPDTRDPKLRVRDSKEIYLPFPEEKVEQQASRCMDCGVPFCHQGCPLGNFIPDFNDAVSQQDWKAAYEILNETNNFPEFTGRICPAPCESSCVLAINKPAVTIELIEKSIIEKAFEMQWVVPQAPSKRSDKKVAIVGSGPAGLAAAAQLNKAGHWVDVFERDDRAGGLLTYGIPDFKLEKWVVDRRVRLMEKEGIRFHYNQEIGKNITLKKLKKEYDAVLLCIGATKPRPLGIPNSDAKGVHFAMEYLVSQNRAVAGAVPLHNDLNAKNKDVIVIGGGDTGSDCVGTANRHGAKSITQFQYRPMPSDKRSAENPWPEVPLTLSTSSSHEEGCDRIWQWLTKEFIKDENGKVTGIRMMELEWKNNKEFVEKPDSEKIFPCDLALIAIGYERPEWDKLNFDLEYDLRGNFKVDNWQTSTPGIFAAGDASRGQSLVVWAISDGREAACAIDEFLMGATLLPSKKKSSIDLINNV